jgi:hypothetical protein
VVNLGPKEETATYRVTAHAGKHASSVAALSSSGSGVSTGLKQHAEAIARRRYEQIRDDDDRPRAGVDVSVRTRRAAIRSRRRIPQCGRHDARLERGGEQSDHAASRRAVRSRSLDWNRLRRVRTGLPRSRSARRRAIQLVARREILAVHATCWPACCTRSQTPTTPT